MELPPRRWEQKKLQGEAASVLQNSLLLAMLISTSSCRYWHPLVCNRAPQEQWKTHKCSEASQALAVDLRLTDVCGHLANNLARCGVSTGQVAVCDARSRACAITSDPLTGQARCSKRPSALMLSQTIRQSVRRRCYCFTENGLKSERACATAASEQQVSLAGPSVVHLLLWRSTSLEIYLILSCLCRLASSIYLHLIQTGQHDLH